MREGLSELKRCGRVNMSNQAPARADGLRRAVRHLFINFGGEGEEYAADPQKAAR